MKIALCAPTNIHALARFCNQSTEGILPGLGSTATTPLITELLRRGHEVTVYTLSRGPIQEQLYEWDNLRIFVGPYRERHIARNFFGIEIAYLTRIIRADQPAFVHAHWTYEFALGALRSGIHTVTTIHDLPWNVLRYYRDPYRAVRLMMAYAVAFEGKQFTAVSNDAADHFRRYFKPGSRIKVIHNGLPAPMFEGSNQAEENEGPCCYATILQGWSRRKNATAALKAFGLVRKQIPDARLLMFGLDYEPGGPAQTWARQQGLEDGVTFAGELPYPELLRRMREEIDVIVHPSLDESFSMAALEGMALSKPVIAGRSTPGVREVLGFGEGGILVNLKQPEEVAHVMVELARDLHYRERIGNDGYKRASSLYRLEHVVTQYENFYQGMLAN